jgi:putative ABC transport system substrate-binding protein
MRRRQFIAGLAGAAAWPVVARAQQRVRRVGWLDQLPERDPGARAEDIAFRHGMEEIGWTAGRNLTIDYRWGSFDVERARLAATELVNLAPDAIVCGGTTGARALWQATRTVPVVFVGVSEPVAQGFVQSLVRPGGNMTGFSYLEPTLGGKWVDLLKEIAPQVRRVVLVFNPDSSPYSRLFYPSIETAALGFAIQAQIALVHDVGEVEEVMTALGRDPGVGLIFSPDGFTYTNRSSIVELAARYRLPAIYGIPSTAADGGLIFYGVDITDQYRLAAGYIDRIIRGEKPADLPVQQPIKFSLTINSKSAEALGLTVPEVLLARADEVIQ